MVSQNPDECFFSKSSALDRENIMTNREIDVVYIAASSHDARYTRICIASIRYFYPDVPIKLLVGGTLEPSLVEEIVRYWNVSLADLPKGDWGWGFIKLEPLFGSIGERFIVLDSDTVFTGFVLDHWLSCGADFLVDDESQSESDIARLYYDWRKVAKVDPKAQLPRFVFNSGQWFGIAGVLTREDFSSLLDWSRMPPVLRYASGFMPGDQGILNYVLNQKAALGSVSVECCNLMRWPAHGLEDLSAELISTRQAPPRVIHWAGLKKADLDSMVGSDILRFFEAQYYHKIPYGSRKLFTAHLKYSLISHLDAIKNWLHLKLHPVKSTLMKLST
jgi:lipopolysaccharide biosynthesis glycosyltransferase